MRLLDYGTTHVKSLSWSFQFKLKLNILLLRLRVLRGLTINIRKHPTSTTFTAIGFCGWECIRIAAPYCYTRSTCVNNLIVDYLMWRASCRTATVRVKIWLNQHFRILFREKFILFLVFNHYHGLNYNYHSDFQPHKIKMQTQTQSVQSVTYEVYFWKFNFKIKLG